MKETLGIGKQALPILKQGFDIYVNQVLPAVGKAFSG